MRNVLKNTKKVNVKIDPNEIVACHRIPGGNSIRPILLKVKNTEVKAALCEIERLSERQKRLQTE